MIPSLLRGGLACVLALSGLGVAGAANAATASSGDISSLEVTGRSIQLVFGAGAINEPVDPASVHLTLDGQEIRPRVLPFQAGGGEVSVRKTMLVVDTSGSMDDNNRLAGAKEAAQAFLQSAPADLSVGLITFDNRARVVVPLTPDHARVASAVRSLTAFGSTAIYDAVVLATRQLGSNGNRNIVLLTDGVPEGGSATASEAGEAIRSSKIRLDAVAFQTAEGRAPLERLVRAGKTGQVLSSANTAELTAQFREAAQRLSNEILINATVPASGPTGQVTLTVNATAGGVPVTDSALAVIDVTTPTPTETINSAPVPVNVGSGPLLDNRLIFIAAGLLFLGLLGTLAFALNAAAPTRDISMKKQLSVYTLTRGKAKKRQDDSTAFGDSAIAQSAVEFAGRIANKRGFEGWLQQHLEAAGSSLKPAEWILLQAIIVLILPLFAFVISGRSLLWTLIAAAFAAARGFVMLDVKARLRRRKFEDALADTLQLMAGSLSAGYSLPQAVDSVVREGQDPISTEFNRALVETRLGVPIDEALETVAERMESKDWAWVVMAIRIQREVGGNLAELLVTVSGTLRERARLRRQVQTLSAEGRLSAWILGGLPIVFTLYLLTARPSYILTLTKEPLGWLMIIGGAIFMTVGALWMKKIVNVEV